MKSLQVFLFGTVRVVHADRPPPQHLTRAVQALLAYLLLQRSHSHPRELLTGLFWSDHCQERARRCLNTALWRLRQVLEPEGILRGNYLLTTPADKVSFNWESDYWLDVASFEEHIQQVLTKPIELMNAVDAQRVEDTLQLYTGDLLEGFYEDWALRERERLRRLYLNSLAHLMHYYEQIEAFEEGLACGRQILEQEPLREEIHREMMCLYCEAGQRPLAVQQYECCCQTLARELGIAPMAETQDLYKVIVEMDKPNPAQSAPVDASVRYRSVLRQLLLARREFDQARQQLQRAIQLAERFAKHPK